MNTYLTTGLFAGSDAYLILASLPMDTVATSVADGVTAGTGGGNGAVSIELVLHAAEDLSDGPRHIAQSQAHEAPHTTRLACQTVALLPISAGETGAIRMIMHGRNTAGGNSVCLSMLRVPV